VVTDLVYGISPCFIRAQLTCARNLAFFRIPVGTKNFRWPIWRPLLNIWGSAFWNPIVTSKPTWVPQTSN